MFIRERDLDPLPDLGGRHPLPICKGVPHKPFLGISILASTNLIEQLRSILTQSYTMGNKIMFMITNKQIKMHTHRLRAMVTLNFDLPDTA
jgi:hypothetical protein